MSRSLQKRRVFDFILSYLNPCRDFARSGWSPCGDFLCHTCELVGTAFAEFGRSGILITPTDGEHELQGPLLLKAGQSPVSNEKIAAARVSKNCNPATQRTALRHIFSNHSLLWSLMPGTIACRLKVRPDDTLGSCWRCCLFAAWFNSRGFALTL